MVKVWASWSWRRARKSCLLCVRSCVTLDISLSFSICKMRMIRKLILQGSCEHERRQYSKAEGAGRDDSMLASVALSRTCLPGTRAEPDDGSVLWANPLPLSTSSLVPVTSAPWICESRLYLPSLGVSHFTAGQSPAGKVHVFAKSRSYRNVWAAGGKMVLLSEPHR